MIKISRRRSVLLHIMNKISNPNPLNIFNVRTPCSPPQHFEYIQISQRYNLEQTIFKWIDDNLKGRFYIGKAISLKDDQIVESLQIGFEQPKELSYFTLACPYLKYD